MSNAGLTTITVSPSLERATTTSIGRELRMMRYITSQFGHPRGFVGRVIGTIMAYENRERNRWTVTLLALQPDDHVLEIGFGPGLAIQVSSERIMKGFVAGIDASAVMMQLACKRNASAIKEERVILTYGAVSALPWRDNSFDKVFAINSMHHWSEPRGSLKEVRRVLKNGGLIAIAEQPWSASATETIQERGDSMAAQLSAAGINLVRLAFKPM